VDIYTNQYGKEGWWRLDCNKENYKKECMRKLSIVILAFIFTFMAVSTYAQSAKGAVMTLEKLEARCASGISYLDYRNALVNAKFSVNLYLESPKSSKIEGLTASIRKVMAHYEFVGRAWQDALSNGGNSILFSEGMELEIVGRYPTTDKPSSEGGARLDNRILMIEAIRIIWGVASDELKITKSLSDKEYSGPEKQGVGIEF
jgi:hypothetical protein